VKTDILPRGFPSVSIAVTRGGRTLLERAWGVANITTGQKAAPTTTYRIGSVAKQFTAAQLFLQSGTTYTLGSRESTTTVTFRVDADGVVTGFTARQNGVDRELRKVK
jgi:hypothetical protein